MAEGPDAPPSRTRRLVLFCALVPLGPLAAFLGLSFLGDAPALLGALMLFSAGGILYLMFQDIAPPRSPFPPAAGAPPFGRDPGLCPGGLAGHILTG